MADTVIMVTVVAVLLISATFYMLPSIIAATRKVPNTGSVVVVNAFLGWTFVGWVVALAMALRSRPQPIVVANPAPGAGTAPPTLPPHTRHYPTYQQFAQPGRHELPEDPDPGDGR